jgi:ADP-ribose pyrophosphatase
MFVYRGRVFSVEVEPVTLPNGREHKVETVRHAPAVIIIPLPDPSHVVLIRQYRHSVRRELWELPAGGVNVEAKESYEAAAIRECEEETGLVPGHVERLAALFPSPGYCDEEMIFFRATDLRPAPADSTRHADEDEDIQVRIFSINDARAMVARGDIVDLKSAYGLTLI